MSCHIKTILHCILLFGFSWVATYASISSSQDRNVENERVGERDDKKSDIFNLLLRNNGNGSRNATLQDPASDSESLTLGPLEISSIGNSSLKRLRLAPWFEKTLRDEIYRRNLGGTSDLPKSLHERTVRSTRDLTSISNRQGRQGLGLTGLGTPVGLTPQQYLLMQQEQRMAAALQQQMLSLQNQRYSQLGQRQRPYRYHDYDDDDSDSDEDDEFDSDEFMSFPIRMGFMPPIPGFPG